MPWHKRRTWVVVPAESPEWLAEKLINHSWCSCQGWSLGGLYWLNDQTSPDGAFEVAVVKEPVTEGDPWLQIDSITFGWMRNEPFGVTAVEKAIKIINSTIAAAASMRDPDGDDDPEGIAIRCEPCDIETPEKHGRCYHCA